MEGKAKIEFKIENRKYLFPEEIDTPLKNFAFINATIEDKIFSQFDFSIEKKSSLDALKREVLLDFTEKIALIFFKGDFQDVPKKEMKKFLKAYQDSIKKDSKEVFLERWGLVDCQITLGEQVIF